MKFMLKLDNEILRSALLEISAIAERAGGSALVVGGSVRDSLLGIPVKDLDIEVYGIDPEHLAKALAGSFSIDLVGQSFGVIKLQGIPIDVSIPRRESKAGSGHRGFNVCSDPGMSVEEACLRRDFTINAMAFDPRSERLYDYHNGVKDLNNRRLRHVSEKFSEDPLRVLRGMQFAARFNLTAASDTLRLCAGLETEDLPKERIFEEWRKMLLKGSLISRGLDFLRKSGWVRYYPELEALIGCRQDPVWHPEGDVWTHTLLCLDAFAAERIGDEFEDLVVGLAVLCHDFGKPLTTFKDGERIRSPGHSEAGVESAANFVRRISDQKDLLEAVPPLVLDHMRPVELHKSKASAAAIRRLSARVGRIDRLVRVARADRPGSGQDLSEEDAAGDWLLAKAEELAVRDSAPVPLVMGRHLIQLGRRPGPAFKPILDKCYDAQLDGEIATLEEGLALVREMLK